MWYDYCTYAKQDEKMRELEKLKSVFARAGVLAVSDATQKTLTPNDPSEAYPRCDLVGKPKP